MLSHQIDKAYDFSARCCKSVLLSICLSLVLVACSSPDRSVAEPAAPSHYPLEPQAQSSRTVSKLFAALVGDDAGHSDLAQSVQAPLLPRQSIQVTSAKRGELIAIAARPLDVGIIAFQPLASSLQRSQSPLVRKAEARYLPYVLKQTMDRSTRWGAVRVMPGQHGSAELNVEGVLLVSDGERLILRISATDSSGRLWLDREYRMGVSASAYKKLGREPFQGLFDTIEADLYRAFKLLKETQRDQLPALALLTYGERLLPGVFSRYFSADPKGVVALQGLPANADPMYRRIQQLRRYEYFFVDTADEQYSSLFTDMQRTYHHWRQYSRELVVYMRDYQARQAGQASGFRRGSLAAMNEVYSDYEWYRMQERYLKELSSGFNNQVLPTVLNLDDQVVHLEGGYENQYQQWQKILSEIIVLERGEN